MGMSAKKVGWKYMKMKTKGNKNETQIIQIY